LLTLKFNFILHNEGLSLVLNLLWEFGRDCVMGGCVLDNETLITLNSLIDSGFLYGPLSNICPLLICLVGVLGVLLGVGWLPPRFPAVCELLKEVGFERSRLLRHTIRTCT